MVAQVSRTRITHAGTPTLIVEGAGKTNKTSWKHGEVELGLGRAQAAQRHHTVTDNGGGVRVCTASGQCRYACVGGPRGGDTRAISSNRWDRRTHGICFGHPQIPPISPKKVYSCATDLAIMYLEYRAKFWRRRQLCAYVCQTSDPYISGFSSNQDSIPGTN